MTVEYLTVSELSQRIKYTEQSIYNLICSGTFKEGEHFFKPTAKKVLFKWQAVINWIEGRDHETMLFNESANGGDTETTTHKGPVNFITI